MRTTDPREVGSMSAADLPAEGGQEMNGRKVVIGTIAGILGILVIAFGAWFKIEATFVPNYRIEAAEKAITDNANGIQAANKRIDQQTIKDYRRQIREIEYEYRGRQMPDDVRKYYDWLKDELDRLIAEQKSRG